MKPMLVHMVMMLSFIVSLVRTPWKQENAIKLSWEQVSLYRIVSLWNACHNV